YLDITNIILNHLLHLDDILELLQEEEVYLRVIVAGFTDTKSGNYAAVYSRDCPKSHWVWWCQ
ncbi:MAG: hypothetical protein IIX05_09100, partial [Selenomonadaceae bacterium]|nr:hypothetical protein [Selenomonadaceae bacterium]